MLLAVFNGSPRGAQGNTAALLEQFLKGFGQAQCAAADVYLLSQTAKLDEQLKAFGQADQVLLAFPLYVDAMPALVKAFIEALEPFCGRTNNPGLLFLVHSGFPEAVHSRAMEHYLKKLAKRLGCAYHGTMIKPGSEGIRHLPEAKNRGTFEKMQELGRIFGSDGRLDQEIVKQLAKPERLGLWQIALYSVLNILGLTNKHWDTLLKKHNAYEKRFDRPYAKEPNGQD